MSAILTIYDTLAGKAVTVGSVTPTVYNLDQLVNSIETANLPVRVLLPVGRSAEGRDFGFVALGTLAKITWVITDLMLWQMVAQGTGIIDYGETLVAYAGAYCEAMRTIRGIGTQAHIVRVGCAPGVFEWPRGSNRWFAGVECTVEVEEVMSG